MVKKTDNEQDKINRERIVDINLILQYMETLDITKEYFTELGEGHLRGLGSVRDEIKFVSKEEVDFAYDEIENYKRAMIEYKLERDEIKKRYNTLLNKYNTLKNKKKWFK